MTIKYAFTQDGGFIAADTNSGLTSYAYPTSTHATKAMRDPQAIADKMMAEQSWRTSESHPNLADYDARNLANLATWSRGAS